MTNALLKYLFMLCLGLTSTFLYAQKQEVVYFDFDDYNLNPQSILQLENWIGENSHIEVSKIYGFCDWKGSNAYNDSLSVKRILTVRNFLLSKQVRVNEDYEWKGFGEDFEQSKVQSENRKVIIQYTLLPKEETTVRPEMTADSPLSDRIKNAPAGSTLVLREINFYNMTPRILPKSKEVLYELLCALEDNPKLKIEIQGHICCQKVYDINDLSVMRARAIYNYLISKKINRKRLSYKGFGTSRPLHPIPEKNALEEEENRRVEILILEK